MTSVQPDQRLRSAADFVRQDAVFADIGTDHAYLPLFLLEQGRIRFAVCADIAEGPLRSARAHAAASGRLSELDFVQTDGLCALADRSLTDIAICGMGGELIADIVSRAPFVKREGVRLILQPMTRQEHLRRYLAEAGFSVIDERYTVDGGKAYLTLCAEYTAQARALTDAEAVVGPFPERALTDGAQRTYLTRKRQALERIIRGKSEGGAPCDAERAMLRAIEEALKER